ncbi:hypothetical protein RRG08_044490 [Elysia crispata]|uniref:Uncharacterized protein n=1 Tax=Elysia crispata TaxID=231223 RepID=A0AAE1D793_9GAST|nr:hypothetical protein RRG08_044490 [Elysia crispata]
MSSRGAVAAVKWSHGECSGCCGKVWRGQDECCLMSSRSAVATVEWSHGSAAAAVRRSDGECSGCCGKVWRGQDECCVMSSRSCGCCRVVSRGVQRLLWKGLAGSGRMLSDVFKECCGYCRMVSRGRECSGCCGKNWRGQDECCVMSSRSCGCCRVVSRGRVRVNVV